MPKPPPLSPIADIFERDSQIASWTARLKQEQALTAVIRREVPRPLAERVRVAGVRGTVLELAVSAGAVATVIRQRTPDMTMALRREGEQNHQQHDDGVFRDLDDKAQVAGVTLDAVEDQCTGDHRERGKKQKPNDRHASERN